MNWSSESYGDFKERVMQWHRIFAWLPVFCCRQRKTVWLQNVWRRAVWSSFGRGEGYEYSITLPRGE